MERMQPLPGHEIELYGWMALLGFLLWLYCGWVVRRCAERGHPMSAWGRAALLVVAGIFWFIMTGQIMLLLTEGWVIGMAFMAATAWVTVFAPAKLLRAISDRLHRRATVEHPSSS